MFMPNCIHTKRLGVILGVALSTIIAGCGSGDGVGRNVAAAASDICTLSSGENPICGYYLNAIRIKTGAAADADPSSGDLFQSSEGAGDSISATVTISRTKPLFDVVRTPASGTAVTVDNRDQDHSVIGTITVVSPMPTTVTIRDVLLYSQTANLTAYVDMIHDYSITVDLTAAPGIDVDYMAAGVWALRTSTSNYEIGAFAFGSEPLSLAIIPGLINTATYTGYAIGLWTTATSATEGASSLFDGTLSLTVNFGDGTQRGSISGVVNEISGIPGSPTITLGNAVITSPNGGFFTGNTQMVFSPTETLNGKWGGEFFGNDGTGATDYPKSTAGTFGGSSTGANARSYVGAFLGYK